MRNAVRLSGAIVGALCGCATSAAWLAAIWFPSAELTLSGVSLIVALAMMLLALLAVIAAVRGHAAVLFVVFFTSFFPVGAYLLSVPHWLRWVGVFNVGFLVAGLLIWRHVRAVRSAGASGGS